MLESIGRRQAVQAGDYLYRAGDDIYDFFVILTGRADIVLESDGQERPTARHDAGGFLGELNLLTGQRVYLSARMAEPGDVLRVSGDDLRRLVATNAHLGDIILTAFMARRNVLLSGASSSLRPLGVRSRPETQAVREFLTRSRIPHEWLDPERDHTADQLVDQLGIACRDLPAVIVSGTVLRRATPQTVSEHLGLTVDRLPYRCFDLVIVGAGPGASPPPCMAHQKVSRRSPSTRARRGDKPGRGHASRTTSGSLSASPAVISRSGRWCRPRSSAHTSPVHAP